MTDISKHYKMLNILMLIR